MNLMLITWGFFDFLKTIPIEIIKPSDINNNILYISMLSPSQKQY